MSFMETSEERLLSSFTIETTNYFNIKKQTHALVVTDKNVYWFSGTKIKESVDITRIKALSVSQNDNCMDIVLHVINNDEVVESDPKSGLDKVYKLVAPEQPKSKNCLEK